MNKNVVIDTQEMLNALRVEGETQCACKNDTLIKQLEALLVTVKAKRETQDVLACIE